MKHKSIYHSRLTREKIDAYRSGSNEVRRETESVADGSFEQDALDGWEESGCTTASMKRLDKRFGFSSPTLYIAGTSVLVAGIVTAVLFMTSESPLETTPQQAVKVIIEQSDAVIVAEIDSLQELPEEEQIQIASIKTTQQEIKSQPNDVPMTNVDEISPAVMEPLKLEPTVETQKMSTQKFAKEIYLHDLKLVDYSAYRSKPVIEIEKIVLSGTTANYEVKQNMEAEPSIQTVAIPYLDYIDKTMAYIGKGKWKQSLQRLNIVLETYPDDLNGHFYAGLCCYNLQQFDEAKQHFATCLQLSYSNFNEEASWYLAQSFLANGEKSNGKELLVTIRDQKWYYAKQAEKLLKGLK
jgi:hypothetical protein